MMHLIFYNLDPQDLQKTGKSKIRKDTWDHQKKNVTERFGFQLSRPLHGLLPTPALGS